MKARDRSPLDRRWCGDDDPAPDVRLGCQADPAYSGRTPAIYRADHAIPDRRLSV